MAFHNTAEERQVIKLLAKTSLPAEVTGAWVEQIQTVGLSEELAEQIHNRLSHPVEGDAPLHNRAILILEFSQLVRKWRLVAGARKFH